MSAEIINIDDLRQEFVYKCNCGSSVFKIEKVTNRSREILCAYCGRLNHKEDIGI